MDSTRDAETTNDEYWHTHVDTEQYPLFHVTSLLYLSDSLPLGNDESPSVGGVVRSFRGGNFTFFAAGSTPDDAIGDEIARIQAEDPDIPPAQLIERISAARGKLGVLQIAPRSGLSIFFSSGPENPHAVDYVTDGVRWAITIPFAVRKRPRSAVTQSAPGLAADVAVHGLFGDFVNPGGRFVTVADVEE